MDNCVLADRIELTPIGKTDESALVRKAGFTVLRRKNTKVDAAAAVLTERYSQEERGRRR